MQGLIDAAATPDRSSSAARLDVVRAWSGGKLMSSHAITGAPASASARSSVVALSSSTSPCAPEASDHCARADAYGAAAWSRKTLMDGGKRLYTVGERVVHSATRNES